MGMEKIRIYMEVGMSSEEEVRQRMMIRGKRVYVIMIRIEMNPSSSNHNTKQIDRTA
jgi:hypothetical protein